MCMHYDKYTRSGKLTAARYALYMLFYLIGALFAFVASAEVLATAVATAFYPNIFPVTLTQGLRPGTTYFIMASLCLVPIPLLM